MISFDSPLAKLAKNRQEGKQTWTLFSKTGFGGGAAPEALYLRSSAKSAATIARQNFSKKNKLVRGAGRDTLMQHSHICNFE